MFKNKFELINALKKDYELTAPLDLFSLRGIAKYNNMIFRFNSYKLQCYFSSMNLWKNTKDDFAEEVLKNLLEQKVTLIKSVNGEDTVIVPKGTIIDNDIFENDGVTEVLEAAVPDELDKEKAEALVSNYKDMESITENVKKEKEAAEAEEQADMPASEVVEEVSDRVRMRDQADMFNERLEGSNAAARSKELE